MRRRRRRARSYARSRVAYWTRDWGSLAAAAAPKVMLYIHRNVPERDISNTLALYVGSLAVHFHLELKRDFMSFSPPKVFFTENPLRRGD